MRGTYMNKRAMKRIPLSKLMDLKIDFAFKQLFGNDKNKEITIVFLNAILKRTGRDTIKEVSFDNVEIGGEHENDKQSRLDILVTTQDQHRINVEIQFNNKYDMVNRSIYYWSKLYSDQMGKGMAYSELKSTIVINILNFDLIKMTDSFHTTYHLYEDIEKFRVDDVFELHFIEIPKLLKDWKEEKLDPWNDALARWLLLLGIVDKRNQHVYEDIYKELEAIAMKDEHLQDAFTSWQEMSLDAQGLSEYNARLKEVLDQEAFVREAKLREEAAKEEGLEQGTKRGLTQGIEQIVRTALEKNMDEDWIVELTGLPMARVREIEQELELDKK